MKPFVKTMLACLAGIFIAGFLFIFVLFSLIGSVASMGNENEGIKENSVLMLELSGTFGERADENPFASLMDDEMKSYGLEDIIASIKEAKRNPDIKGIYLQAGTMEIQFPSLEEIRGELEAFKESGKFVVAYGDQYSQWLYYLASVADKVVVNPEGSISWHGLAAQPIFFKDLLEKVGVEMQIFKVGTYKSAVEPFIATEMSDANREQVSEYLASIWNDVVNAVSQSRGIEAGKLNEYADRYMDLCQAEEYVECGLADTLLYKDGVLDYLKTLVGAGNDGKLAITTLEDVKEKIKTDNLLTETGKAKIAVYYAVGDIDGSSSPDEGINSKKVIKELRELREDPDVKAVVLRVNSTGGSAYGSEQIWREVVLLKAAKPVIVSMGDYAASGGYYISCAADCIVANSTTLTGSIGIFGMFPVAENLLKEKIGLDFDVVKTNRLADMGSLSRTFRPEESAIMQNYVNDGYVLFLERCAEGRNMSIEEIDKIGQGRVWTGNKAKELGLVDEIGDLDKAIGIAAQRAGLGEYVVKSYPEVKDFMTELLEGDEKDYMESAVHKAMGEYYDFIRFVRNVKNAAPIQARMPFELVIR
ncbi:MAG: signal peptide peptidase SppA [Bacteroidaceae bacterium]|nr:signal peptide peptidase SppA [Bacteroidaceae bacterium]